MALDGFAKVIRDTYAINPCAFRHSPFERCARCEKIRRAELAEYERTPQLATISFPADDLGRPVEE